jgi:hypothetical protein
LLIAFKERLMVLIGARLELRILRVEEVIMRLR